MALPVGITTCALNVGPLIDFGGDAYIEKVEWQPVLDGRGSAGNVRSITWTATGQALASFPEKVESSPGGTVTLPLPHVDQSGFIDGSGDAVTNWTYRIKVTARDSARKTYTKVKYIQPVVGQTTLDFDLIEDGTVVVPVVTPTGRVTSVNGDTGAITVPSVADLADEIEARADADALLQPIATLPDAIEARVGALYAGPTLPAYDPGAKYVWIKTDAVTGDLIDIITGVAS